MASSFPNVNVIELLLLSGKKEVAVTEGSRIRVRPLKKHGAMKSWTAAQALLLKLSSDYTHTSGVYIYIYEVYIVYTQTYFASVWVPLISVCSP